MKRSSEFDQKAAPAPYWSGEPYQGMYVRPGDAFTVSFCVLFSLVILYFSVRYREFFSIIPISLFIFYCTFGRLFIDKIIRSDLLYELWPDCLLIIKKSTAKVVTRIPICDLIEIKPSWEGDIASIDMPQSKIREILFEFDRFDRDIPSLRYGRRLELMKNPAQVAELIRDYAKTQISIPITQSR